MTGVQTCALPICWIFAGHQLGAATAAFGAGLSRTLLVIYLPEFFVAGALCLFAFSCHRRFRMPRHGQHDHSGEDA